MTEKLTPWFPGDVTPVHKGVYPRRWGRSEILSKWDGQNWCAGDTSLERAAAQTKVSIWQSLPWRGLAQDPAKEVA